MTIIKGKDIGLINAAAMHQLQLCLSLFDELGYTLTSAHISSAIEAMNGEALSEAELSDKKLGKKDVVRRVVELFASKE